MPESREVLRLEDLRKSYNIGQPNEVEVLHGIDLRLDSADFAALVGPSGSGKSTLLNLIGLLDSPTSGELYLDGQPTRTMDDEARTALRGRHIGFVFQFHHLIGAFTALENVLMPSMVAHGRPTRRCWIAPASCWPPSAWRSSPTVDRTSFPVASSNAWPLPVRW
jgi:ABC-type antimicrobial peptide transport system, ATPase component